MVAPEVTAGRVGGRLLTVLTETPTQPAAVYVATASLKPWAKNPRKNDPAVQAVADSIKRFGFGAPLLVRKASGEIIAGHTRLKAAVKLGLTEVPVRYLDLSESEAHALALADNRVGEIAEWDDEALAAVLRELEGEDVSLDGLGWTGEELEAMIGDVDLPGDGDDVPPVEEVAVSRVGEVYDLGPHRLACGDSTSPEVWAALGCSEARAVFTDPPFGVDYIAIRGHRKIANDATPAEAVRATAAALASVKAEAWFVCCSWRSIPTMLDAMLDAGLDPKACIVWDKMRRVQNLDRFAKQHEFILYAGPYGGQPTADVDVWQFARDFEPDHPTPKPIDLVARALVAATDVGDLVVDMFAGSGAMLIASAKTRRIARLIELDPAYCDVIRRRWTRWAKENGQDPGPGALDG